MIKTTLFKLILISTIFLLNFVVANSHTRLGANVSLEINNQGLGQPSTITILTDPAETRGQEFGISVRNANWETVLRTVVTSSENGEYSFPIVFDSTGEWGIWMRYGLGLENFERTQRFVIGDEVDVLGGSSSFRGSLAPDVPNYVQPMGYAIFGTLLLCTLLMLTRLFYWLNKQHRTKTL